MPAWYRGRKWAQGLAALMTNPDLREFWRGRIYQGPLKAVCVPGLNCYSCPAAVGACPIGSMQAIICDPDFRVALYVTGLVLAFGGILGRFICGWLCPFGWVQELLHRIPSPKVALGPRWRWLRSGKYVVLVVFVLALPALWRNAYGFGELAFCKYICPAGTLEAGLPLLALNGPLRASVGLLFAFKALLLGITIVAAVVLVRPFCRFVCPLGAIYALMNRVSLYQMHVDESRCTQCGACSRACGMGVAVHADAQSPECIRCGDCIGACPHKAIGAGFRASARPVSSRVSAPHHTA